MKKQIGIFFEEKVFRSRGKIRYRNLSVHEKINLKGNCINHTESMLWNKQALDFSMRNVIRLSQVKYIERLIQLVQFQWASKTERRVFHHQYSKTNLFY